MKESRLSQQVRLALGTYAPHCIVFRNPTGSAWVGSRVLRPPDQADRIILLNPRKVQYGLIEGSSDLIGWRSVSITPDMVGQTVAQFLALELKTKNVTLHKDQRHFLKTVINAGGRAAEIRTVDEAIHIALE